MKRRPVSMVTREIQIRITFHPLAKMKRTDSITCLKELGKQRLLYTGGGQFSLKMSTPSHPAIQSVGLKCSHGHTDTCGRRSSAMCLTVNNLWNLIYCEILIYHGIYRASRKKKVGLSTYGPRKSSKVHF